MTKSDLIEKLAEKLKLPVSTAEMIVNTVFDSMVEAMQREDRIEIRGFGSFEIRHYKSYQGRNPKSGEAVHVNPKKLPFFKVGKELEERVDEGRDKYPLVNVDDAGDDTDEETSEVGVAAESNLP